MTLKRRPVFSFGVIADVQYADKNSRSSGSRPESTMYYRKGVAKLINAVNVWIEKKDELSFVLNLGDIIDGNETEVNKSGLSIYHVIGNHCLRVPRDELLRSLGLKDSYYSLMINDEWRLIVLDTNDLGHHAWNAPQIEETKQFLEEHSPEDFPSVQRWNGGIASQQMNWLVDVLERSKVNNEKVIVACHHPVGEGSARLTHMAWNYSQISSILLESGIVHLVLSGHDHPGGYNKLNGTHFLTLHSVVEGMTFSS
eukprot:g4207.t1